MPRKYVSCLGKGCMLEDDDFDGGYSRLDPGAAGDGDSIAMGERQTAASSEDDYFRPPNSYQWNQQADNDQGQEETEVVDLGSHMYTGVQVGAKKDKKRTGKKSIGKRIRHFLRVSFKWMKRGFFTMGPAVTPQIIMNPATAMSSVMGKRINGANRSMVYL